MEWNETERNGMRMGMEKCLKIIRLLIRTNVFLIHLLRPESHEERVIALNSIYAHDSNVYYDSM